MSPKNRKADDSAGDDIAGDDASEDASFEDVADNDALDDEYADDDEDEGEYDDEDGYEEDTEEDGYEDDAEYEEEDDDGVEDEPQPRETPAERRKRIDRVNASARLASIKPGQSSMSTKWAIDRLDQREKLFSFVAGGAAGLFGIIIYLVETQNHNFRLAKGQITPQTTLVVGLAAAALLIATTILGRRAPVGFVALFTGAALGGSYLLLGLPFFALAVWLLFRSYKIQKETTAQLREAGGGTRARPSPASRSAATSGRAPAKAPVARSRPTTVAEARRARSKKSSAPVGNKRYTPKRPSPPPPKPSRRQRKAAASD
ncbi:MAG TPA: hypothetical protein VG412_02535 [Acidimicrobiales bacterium]|nr:hypothetical protein [Acidimicrobiales bacterium]